ncbi:NAD(P)H-binding protein [Kribbella sp. NPDC004536]|uniref:NAD(P)H-binding protein n=1 Tax=Kribbella sp. NPDC004536 TaxID=3364106 RepID=UPI003684F116
MILITGANGAFGRRVVEYLLDRPAKLAVSVREPARAAELAAKGVDVRHGDFDAPETLAKAYEGAETILINATNYGSAVSGRIVDQLKPAVQAARAAGAERLVITTWQDLDNCPLPYAQDFRTVEELARHAFPTATVLRMTYGVAASVARDVQWAEATGLLSAPAGTARVAPAATDDLAAAAANAVLTTEIAARTYELTGPDAIDWNDLAGLAGVEYRAIDDDQFRAQAEAAGFPPEAVGMLLDYYAAFRSGSAGTPTTDLADLLGRPPVSSLEAVRRATN